MKVWITSAETFSSFFLQGFNFIGIGIALFPRAHRLLGLRPFCDYQKGGPRASPQITLNAYLEQ